MIRRDIRRDMDTGGERWVEWLLDVRVRGGTICSEGWDLGWQGE